MDAKYRF